MKVKGSSGHWSVTDGRTTLGEVIFRPAGRCYVAVTTAGKTLGSYETLQAAMAAFDASVEA